MKKVILIIVLFVGLFVIVASLYIYPYLKQAELGKTFYIEIK